MQSTRREKSRNVKNHKSTSKSKPSITERCSPAMLGKTKSFTCYSNEVLEQMKHLWNTKHVDSLITASDPHKIWDNLRERFANVCDTEKCWMRQKFIQGKLGGDIMKYTFAPDAPNSWSSNPTEWLSSSEITSVMSHFEKYFSQFAFIGPSPIDFDKVTYRGECVWEELCNFKLSKMIAKRKLKIGIVFNTDIHTGEGEHWVSMFIDLAAKPYPYIFYFDSAGDPVMNEVNVFSDRIIDQAKALGIDLKFYENKKEHQKGASECGMYALYMIIELLTGRKNYEFFLKNRVPDNSMKDFRNICFNKGP